MAKKSRGVRVKEPGGKQRKKMLTWQELRDLLSSINYLIYRVKCYAPTHPTIDSAKLSPKDMKLFNRFRNLVEDWTMIEQEEND